MSRILLLVPFLLFTGVSVFAEESADETTDSSDAVEEEAKPTNGDGVSSPKTMSGMSILGNEETPKSLVIVPWKSSEMGDAISLTDTLDDRATPVDKEVFMRELRYFAIRNGE
ncbi:MAG: hypothetical protein P8Y01_07990 [Woeseiaceae bacterium]|jgi:hypothetical protein